MKQELDDLNLPFMAKSAGPPWLPAPVVEAREIAWWTQWVLALLGIMYIIAGILSFFTIHSSSSAFWAGYSGPASEGSPRLNHVGNTLVPGPSTGAGKRNTAFVGGSARTGIHQRGNRLASPGPGAPTAAATGWELFSGSYDARPERFPFPEVVTEEAEVAYRRVLGEAGASLARDAVDRSVIRSVERRGGSLIDSQKQVGGWPSLRSGPPPADSDRDGMPDAWEAARGLDAADRRDGAAVGPLGTTNLEAYLAERARVAAPGPEGGS